jgi:hypothetical protein
MVKISKKFSLKTIEEGRVPEKEMELILGGEVISLCEICSMY